MADGGALPPLPPAAVPAPPQAPNIAQDFVNTLTGVIGMTAAQATTLTNNGITDVGLLALCNQEFVLSVHTGVHKLNIMVKSRLEALLNWTFEQDRIIIDGNTIDITDFTLPVCETFMRKARKRARDTDTGTKKDDLKAPEPFSGKEREWKKKKREFIAYLGRKPSRQDGIPLSYVVYIPNDPDFDIGPDAPSVMQQIVSANRHGQNWEADNVEVHNILTTWTSSGTAETYVDLYRGTRDGQAAWMNLHSKFDGRDAQETIARQGREMIRSAHFHSSTSRFSLEDYCNRHIRANQLLSSVNQAKPGREQVELFLQGIQNDKLISLKTQILANQQAHTDLNSACELFKSLYQSTVSTSQEFHQKTQGRREIGSIHSGRGGRFGRDPNRGGHGRFGRHHNHGRGRSGGRHGGRGRGRYNFSNNINYTNNNTSNNNNNNYDNGGYLDPKVLDAMTPSQQKMFFHGRDQLRANNQRNASSETRAEPPPQPEIQIDHTSIATDSTSASTQFGRANRNLAKSTGKRSQGRITITSRRVSGTQQTPPLSDDFQGRYRLELDSRADTVCFGRGWRLDYYTGQEVDVSGFHDTMDTLTNIPIGAAFTALDHPSGVTYILHAHEGLCFFDSMEHSLLPPAQLWDNGLKCDITPKHCSGGHSIFGIEDPSTHTHLPFNLYGCIAYLPTRLPTDNELATCQIIELTSDIPWEPYSIKFQHRERPFQQQLTPTPDTTPYDFATNRTICPTSSQTHRSNVLPHDLARRWGTSLPVAQRTLQVTTQRGMRFVSNDLTRRFRTRQAQLQYTFQRGPVYSDTLFNENSSIRGNKCAQIFVASNDHAVIYPLKSKSDAFTTLNSYSTKFGIPNPIITDNAGEETGDDWERVRKKFLMEQRLTEPYSPWQNRAESEIRELKKHFRRIMNKSRTPEQLWCYGLEYTSEIRTLMSRVTANERTTHEGLLGDTPDISEYTEFDFHGFIKYYEPSIGEELGRWLGVCKNVGTAMVYYILKQMEKL
jgi:hypothetical protein